MINLTINLIKKLQQEKNKEKLFILKYLKITPIQFNMKKLANKKR